MALEVVRDGTIKRVDGKICFVPDSEGEQIYLGDDYAYFLVGVDQIRVRESELATGPDPRTTYQPLP